MKAVSEGYKAVKFDPFESDEHSRLLSREVLRRTIEKIRLAREAFGPAVDIFNEGHARLNVHMDIKIGRMMEPFDPYFFEKPIPPGNVDAMERHLSWADRIVEPSLHPRDGYVEVPDRPGLGVELNLNVVSEHLLKA